MEKEKKCNLDQFQLLKYIGRGSFSKVYLIKNIDTGKIYAAKIIKNKINEDSFNQEELLPLFREVNLISSLNHPSILKFIGFSPTDFKGRSHPTIVTKFEPNGSLRDIINLELSGRSPEGWDDTRKLINIYGIASGLQYLHHHNIIHRDMKPENILMDEYLFPKIADFGFSKITSSVSQSLNVQSFNHFKGTPVYMAPEILNEEPYSKSVDVYAFSIVVYEILTGITPFTNISFHQLLVKVGINNERPQFDKNFPNHYKKLIENCWSANSEKRPTFDQIIDDLKNNKEFITETINEIEFYDYIDYIEDYKSSFDLTRTIHFGDILKRKGKSSTISKVKVEPIPQKIREIEEEENEKTQTKSDKQENSNDQIIKENSPKSDPNNSDSQNVQCNSNNLNDKSDTNNSNDLNGRCDPNDPKYSDSQNVQCNLSKRSNSAVIEKYDNDDGCIERIPVTKSRSKSLFFHSKKDSSLPKDFSYPIDEFNKLDEVCQSLVTKAKDDPTQQFLIGRYLIEGSNNFPQNIEIGVKYLTSSISQNCTESLIYYCQMLIDGTLIPSDIEKAKKYLKNSNNNNNNDARVSLLYGKIMKKEKKVVDAKKSFEKSAKNGNKEAMYEYAKMLFKGEGCKKNDKEAIKFFELSNRNGYEKAGNFITAFEKVNKLKGFNKLKGETQKFLISQIIKSEFDHHNGKWKHIYISPNKAEMLYSNNSLKSSDFFNVLSNFKDISIQINYPSKSLESFNSFVSKFKSFEDIEVQLYVIILTSVSTIKMNCFKGLNSISQISIPSSVTCIEDHSFESCSSLLQILIPFSVNSIGKYSFVGCNSMNQASIISNIETIPIGAFSGCSLLSEISFPSSVTKIENYAFYGCSSLVVITIPSCLTKIGNYAFYGCLKLTQISIPKTIQEIGCYCFNGCSSLKKFTFFDLPVLSCEPCLTEVCEGTFANCSSLISFQFLHSISSIGKNAFIRCSSLNSIEFGSSISFIGENAFARCSSLSKIKIPQSVTEIGENAFGGCSSLKEIEVPSSIDVKNIIGINDNVKVTRI